jgi:cell division protein FtsB
MAVTPELSRSRVRRTEGAEPLRRKSMAPPRPQGSLWRRALNYLLVFATVVLLADALVGERGLVATTRARRQSAELQSAVGRLRHENARLNNLVERLETDPLTIESAAREKLGLIRPGEKLVVMKDVAPPPK